jgi:HSP20 family molecular chaperone IbpA
LESKDSYLIRAELPGMKKEDFHLEVKDGTLTLTGERNPRRLTASNTAVWNGLAENFGDRFRFGKP